MKDKKLIILFDLDGTLIDSTDAILESFYVAFGKINFDFKADDEKIKELIGYPLDKMFVSLGGEEKDVFDFVSSYKEHYRKISQEKTTLLPKAYESLELASQIARLSVVTTKTRKYTIPLLKSLGILDFFEIVTGTECVKHLKPHPEPILSTLKKMNYKENDDEVYMIGDTKLDLIAANKAQVKGIGVLCGYGKKEDLEKYTQTIKENSLEAINFIKSA